MSLPSIPSIIGITGRAGSGKSLAANWLILNNAQVVPAAFARPLKRMIYELLREALPKSWPHTAAEYINDPVLKETPIPFLGDITPRRLMQTLGTEWGRHALSDSFWVGLAEAKLEATLGSGFKGTDQPRLRAVFDDVRFANEADMIRRRGGVILRILRPDAEKAAEIAAHTSESMDFEADVTLINDSTPADLHAKLAAIWPATITPKKS